MKETQSGAQCVQASLKLEGNKSYIAKQKRVISAARVVTLLSSWAQVSQACEAFKLDGNKIFTTELLCLHSSILKLSAANGFRYHPLFKQERNLQIQEIWSRNMFTEKKTLSTKKKNIKLNYTFNV